MEMILTPKEECIIHIAQTNPSLPALRFGDEVWSYSILWKRILGLAIKIGQITDSQKAVGVYMGMEPEFFTAVHATWLSGHGAVILNPDWTDFEIRNVVVQGNVGLILHAFFTPSADFADITRFRTSDLYGTEGSSETQESLRSFNDTDSLSNVTDAELRGNLVEVGDDFLVSAVIVEALETVFSDFEASDQSGHSNSPILDIAIPSDSGDSAQNSVSEIAMSIAERVAILSKSYRPVPIDMPLDIPHLDEDAINHLYTWLRTSYDWEGTMDRLFEQDVTPETLAYEIVDAWDCVAYPGLQGYTWAVEDSNEVNPIQEVDLGDGIWDERDCVMRSPEDPQQQIPTICVSPVVEDTPSSLGEPVRNKRTRRTHKDLPNLHLSPNETRKDFLRVPSSPTLLFSPPPAYASTTTDDLNIGMAPYEVWSGKKAGLIMGLLALGSFMSPPPTPHPTPIQFGETPCQFPSTLRSRRDLPPLSLPLDSPSLAFPDAPHIQIYSSTPAESTSQDIGSGSLSALLSATSSMAGLLSPWLEVVRIHGVEPVQSPWVADIPSSGCLSGGCGSDQGGSSGGGGRFPRSVRTAF